MARHFQKFIASLITLITFTLILPAEMIYDKDFGFSLDIPEGFEVADATEDGTSILFTHPNIDITLAVKIYYKQGYKSSIESLDAALNKLSAKASTDELKWEGQKCAVSTFEMDLDQKYKGWAAGAPIKLDSYLVLLCYSPESIFQQCQYFIVSTINSLSINDELHDSPGIFMDYAFPKSGNKTVNARIAGQDIKSIIDASDEDAAECLVNIEYSVLMMYANHPKVMQAWERYYRLIYRDSYSRLSNFSSDLFNKLYPIAKAENPENPEIAYAQKLLSWVQGFHYKRAEDAKSSDFTNLPAMLTGSGNDCDSRSMLMCVLLKSVGIDSIFLFSPSYSHAMVGTAIKAPGQTYLLKDGNKEYLMGETTANVTWGMIAQDHGDRNKWVPVILP
ncbi:MAG: hypothetical protein K5681_05850 [Treponema sp.]|nr:hypothetical protein [Treponema sp.]